MTARRWALLILSLTLAIGCASERSKPAGDKPAGTPTDPVEVCERLADVCRYRGSQLGVCTAPTPGSSPAECVDRSPCYLCMPQH